MIFSKILSPELLQCYICVAALFMKPLPKRDHFGMRFISSAIICLLCAVPLSSFHVWASAAARTSAIPTELGISVASAIEMLLYLTVITGFFAVCCEIRPLHAAYCSACAYLTQDLAYTIFVFLRPDAAHRGRQPLKPDTLWLELLILVIYSALFYKLIASRILPKISHIEGIPSALLYMLITLFVGRIFGTLASISAGGSNTGLFRIILLYDMLLTSSLLVAQTLIFKQSQYRRKLAMESQLRQQQYQQFTQFQESVDNIRHKCHDLKHMIAALQEGGAAQNQQLLQELQTAVNRYDASINTGNNTLDALLGKTLNSCEQRDIQWTCMADGKALEFMDPFDLYIMLGNALDNAIECLSAISESQKRFLSVNIRCKNGLVLLSLRNYCDHELDFEDGLPLTTKSEKIEHGYGTRSIREIAEKYNGKMSTKLEQHIFTLNILLPLAQ